MTRYTVAPADPEVGRMFPRVVDTQVHRWASFTEVAKAEWAAAILNDGQRLSVMWTHRVETGEPV